jgi:hypothetical protein
MSSYIQNYGFTKTLIQDNENNLQHEIKWQGDKIRPTYEESLRTYNIKIDENKSLKILPRTKDHSLRIKIINTNIIISTLYRINGVFLYNKTIKDDYPDEISSNINFTKGYLVCFNQKCVNIFKLASHNLKFT